MDHHETKERAIAIQYLLGQLPVEERMRFEEHYIDCEVCLDRMDLVEEFRQALRKTAEEATPLSADFSSKSLAQPKARWKVSLVLSAFLLLALLLAVEILRLRQELHNERAITVRQFPTPFISITPEASPIPAKQDRKPAPLLQPEANTPIFALSSIRGGEKSSAGLFNKIEIPRLSQRIVFSLELDGAPEYRTYRATISSAGGRLVWRESYLHPNHDGTLTVLFPSTYFSDGDYLLILDGLAAEKQFVAVASYPFRTSRKNLLK